MGDSSPPPAPEQRQIRARARSRREARVQTIMRLMRANEWSRRVHWPALAAEWGAGESTIREIAGEASRRIMAAEDPREVRGTVCEGLRKTFDAAVAEREYRSVAQLGDVWTKILGAQAPSRQEIGIYGADHWQQLRSAIVRVLEKYPGALEELERELRGIAPVKGAVLEVDHAGSLGQGDRSADSGGDADGEWVAHPADSAEDPSVVPR